MTAVLLVSRSHEYEARLREVLGEDLTSVMGAFLTFGTDAVMEHVRGEEAPEVAFLGPYLSYDNASELSAGLRDRYPAVSIVLVHENYATIGGWASELGADAVISPIADDTGVLALVARLADLADGQVDQDPGPVDQEPGPVGEEPEPADEDTAELWAAPLPETVGPEAVQGGTDVDDSIPEPPAQVIAVVSPKGGLGKTTVATNLAIGLARLAPDSVVLVDADLQFGDVAAALALSPTHTLPDMVTGLAPRDTMVLKTFLTSHPSGFYAVCGSDSPADGDRITGEQFAHLLRQLAGAFRYVVVDTTPGLGEHALTALDLATDAVFMCSLQVPNLRALRKELAVLTSIGALPSSCHIVLNLADKTSGLNRRDAEAIIGAAVDVVVPRSKAVPLSTNRGIPLLQEGSRDPAARALRELVTQITGAPMSRVVSPTRKAVA